MKPIFYIMNNTLVYDNNMLRLVHYNQTHKSKIYHLINYDLQIEF